MTKRILLIAFHFPPQSGSSGMQRTLRLVQHLPSLGWEPIVLTVRPQAYERTSQDLLAEVPPQVVVQRAYALDAARHLSIKRKYLACTARPDRWMSWKYDGIKQGLWLIEQYSPNAIWSTYPIPTAHVIGAALQKQTGLPWVADFRDPMTQEGYPADTATRNQLLRIEAQTIQLATMATFTTPGAGRMYKARYPNAKAQIAVLENGYDEDTFKKTESEFGEYQPLNRDHLTLLHSGIVYPTERDPTKMFEALGQLKQTSAGAACKLKIRFRAAVHNDLLHALADKHGVNDMVEILPAVSYQEALTEMLRADGLLVLQAACCNSQIPAKLYEYFRSKRPVIALTHPAGDTAATLASAGVTAIADLADAKAIKGLLQQFVAAPLQGTLPTNEAIANASRAGRAAQFVRLLQQL